MNCYCLSLHTNFCLKIDPDKIPETERGRGICDIHQLVERYKDFEVFMVLTHLNSCYCMLFNLLFAGCETWNPMTKLDPYSHGQMYQPQMYCVDLHCF